MLPSPLIERVFDVWDVVKAVGWQGAKDLCTESFVGWEVEFLGHALGVLRRFDDAEDREAQRRALLGAFGGAL